MVRSADLEFYRRRTGDVTEEVKSNYSVTQDIRETLIREGHTKLVVESITQSIAKVEAKFDNLFSELKGDLLIVQTEVNKKVSDTGAWDAVKLRSTNRLFDSLGRVAVWAAAAVGLALITGLLHYAWKGMHAT